MTSKMPGTELAKLARDFRATASATDSAIFDFLSALDCPRSLAVWLLYINKEHQQLVDLGIRPEWYNNSERFRTAYAATEFLSKSDFLKLDVNRKDVAFKRFFEFEELCKATNNRFRNPSVDPLYTGANVWLLNATKQKIALVLGDFRAEEVFDEANWGPGVTTLLKGEHVSAVNKFHSENGITRDLYALVGDGFADAYPLWARHIHRNSGGNGFTFQRGNSVVTVPKNAKTDRVIAVEPGGNLWFQKAAGVMIRRRLRRFGVNLNSQERNQQLARLSSLDNSLATVDFSSASDSIARELVRELLPSRWFTMLNAFRSVIGTHNNDIIRWEKFSSMGNGFTFELESLIFFCAALAVREYLKAEGEVNVFGDDVILPRTCYELFSSFSEFLGFRVNPKKSFSNSAFRESCGSHYYLGANCKPIYLKERLRNVESFYKLANSVRTLAHRRNSHYGCDSRFRRCWVNLFRGVPKPLRFGVPLGKGDGGFVVNFDEATPSRARDGIEGYHYRNLVNTGVTQFFEGEGLLLARLWVISAQAHGNSYTLRGRSRLRVTSSLVPQWYNLGPWI